eukprot:jgi/Chlat1/4158/Chrsp27S08874
MSAASAAVAATVIRKKRIQSEGLGFTKHKASTTTASSGLSSSGMYGAPYQGGGLAPSAPPMAGGQGGAPQPGAGYGAAGYGAPPPYGSASPYGAAAPGPAGAVPPPQQQQRPYQQPYGVPAPPPTGYGAAAPPPQYGTAPSAPGGAPHLTHQYSTVGGSYGQPPQQQQQPLTGYATPPPASTHAAAAPQYAQQQQQYDASYAGGYAAQGAAAGYGGAAPGPAGYPGPPAPAAGAYGYGAQPQAPPAAPIAPKPSFTATPAELDSWFRSADSDRNGEVDERELQQLLTHGTSDPFNPQTIKLMIKMFDTKNSGRIGFPEFQALWKYLHDWKVCFDGFDRDRSGSIDAGELQTALRSFGYSLSPALIQTLMSKFDRSGRAAAIRLDDFMQCCVLLQGFTDRFRKHDTRQDGNATLSYETFLQIILTFVTV